MIFNKTGRLLRRNFFLGNVKLENVRSYKYLGIVFTPSGEVKSALDDLRSRALKAYMSLKHNLGNCFNAYIEDTAKLFDSLIKPILLYSSDFWGCLKLPTNNPIENLHITFCKHLLGVQAQTTNAGVLLEVGRIPLNLSAQKAGVKNWERIRNSGANHFLTMSYKSAQTESLHWLNKISICLQQNGLGNFFIEETGPFTPSIHNKLYERLKDIFHQKSFSSINETDSKLRTYSLIKESIGMETYLKTIRNINYRVSLSRFRLSNHKLMIEVGRHQKLPKSQRFCPFCPNIIEDEIHFLINCDL